MWGWYSRYNRSCCCIWLQKGCVLGRVSPVLKLGTQPEMLSPAILNRSMPRTPPSDMKPPPFLAARKPTKRISIYCCKVYLKARSFGSRQFVLVRTLSQTFNNSCNFHQTFSQIPTFLHYNSSLPYQHTTYCT